MSFFKKLIKGVLIGAAVGLTGGLALGAIPGSLGLTTLTGAALLKTATIWGAVYGGLQGASMGLIKKPKMSTGEVNARQNITVDPQALGKWIFGQTAAATDVVYAETIEDTAIVHVVCAAAHQIDSYQEFYIDDQLVTFAGTAATGEWAGVLTIVRNLGTQTQTALGIPDSEWPEDARGLGVAHYGMRWDFASEQGKKKLAGGIPTRITQVVRGCLVYDPRLDSTRGGDGTHRADDQSTWQWSDNWALIVAHYLLGWRNAGALVYGAAIAPDDIDWPSVAAMADVCDTVLDGKPRYRIGGIFAITQDHQEVIGQLEAAVGGKVGKFGGKYYLWVPHDDLTPVGTITDDMIIADAGVNFSPAGPLETLYNSARGRFVDPALQYQLAPYPGVTESAAVTEDGRERLLEHDFSIIQDVEIAQRVARELVRRSRFSGTMTLVAGPAALVLRPFDVVELNTRETNNQPELFRVVAMQYSGMGPVIVQLLEEDASIYDVSSPLGTALTQLSPDAYDPSVQIPLTGLDAQNTSISRTGGGAVDAIRVFWNTPGGFVDHTEVGYRINATGDYTYLQNSEVDQAFIAPAISDALYEIRARHVSRTGVRGEWETTLLLTGNADFDRVTALGLLPPIDPKIFVDPNPVNPLTRIRISLSYDLAGADVIPDRLFVFYSVAEVPNKIRITTDAGSKLYLSTLLGEGVSSEFTLIAAAGSSTNVLRYVPDASADPDLYGLWWASVRNPPGPSSGYYKVIESDATTLRFAPDVNFGFTPTAGQIIDIAEVDYSDGRTGEFLLAWCDGEVVRHRGIRQDETGYYLDVIERGAEGSVQANQSGKYAEYYPAPGPQTDIIEISAGDFTEQDGMFSYTGRVLLNLPAQFSWSAVTCCLARAVAVEGRQVFIRSHIVPLYTAGPA
jgi:hypothetical protein